jgi:O-antigen/teichoic acid export membrane protein
MSSQAEARAIPAIGVARTIARSSSFAAQDGDDKALSAATVRGGLFLASRYGLGVIVSIGNMLVMTWWIGPHAYGVFVTAIGLVTFLSTLARSGIDTYLVRYEGTPDASMYNTASAIILSASVSLALLAGMAAPLLIRWYGNREFVAPYSVLLLTIPITGLTGIPMAKLERRLDFRNIAGIELGGQSLGLAVAILFAWLKAGVWAPVAGLVAWQTFTFLSSAVLARWVLRMAFNWRQARVMLSFGVGMTASLRMWQLRTLVNPLLVGRFVGAEGVAFVALAIRIAEALGTFRLAAGRIAIAALARLQDNRKKFCNALQHALFLQVISLGPLLCVFAACGPSLVRHLIGLKWMPSLAVYPFIAAGVLVNSVYNLQASALFVVGRQWVVMRSYTTHVLLLAISALLLVPRFGIAAYGWSELLACGAYFTIHRGLARTAPISYRRLGPWAAVFMVVLFLPQISHVFQNLTGK